MKIQGAFETAAEPSQLVGIVENYDALNAVQSFRSVEKLSSGSFRVDFAPRIAMGWIRMDTELTPGVVEDNRATVHALAIRGQSAVEGDVEISFEPGSQGSRVTWEADLVVLGPAASTSQRVAASIATRAVGDALVQAADAAAKS